MALTFEKTIMLPTYGDQMAIAQESNGTLYQYYIDPSTEISADKNSARDETYTSFSWGGLAHHLTTRAVADIKIKQFPLIGAIGAYKNLYTNKTSVLAPVHIEQKTFNPPTLQATLSNNQIHIVLTPPQNITYTVYRVVMRNTYFAVEYILYNPDSYVDVPGVIGSYEVTAIGYNETTGAVSSESNSVTISVTTGKATWEPAPVALALGNLSDVNISSPQNLQRLQYNTGTAKWQNSSQIALNLSDLQDVDIEEPQNLQLLQYIADTAKWQNKQIPKVVTATLTATDWANNQQIITVTGVVADETKQFIQPTPTISARGAYENAGIRCINQGLNSLSFKCEITPTANITLYISITEVSV